MNKKTKVLLVYPNSMMANLLPIHVSILSAVLKKNGFEVQLFDTTYYKTNKISTDEKKVELLQVKKFDLSSVGAYYKNTDIYEDFRKKVLDYEPDLIGVTLVENTFELANKLMASIKDINIPKIAGGVFAYSSWKEILKTGLVNMVCIGEGEETLLEICEKIEEGKDYYDVENLAYIKDGNFIRNNVRKLVDFNKLPYLDYDIFEDSRIGRPMHGKIFRMIHVELDRGCPYFCSYCEAPSIKEFYNETSCQKYYRQKENGRIIAEMKHLANKYNADYIDFNSETFLARSVDNLKEFSKLYKKEVNLPFWCQTRPETITEEKIKILKDMGCSDIQFGIEHGNHDFRKRVLNRNVNNELMLKGLKIVEKYKIPYTVNNIIGFPGETRELVFDTINFNRMLKPKTMNCYIFSPFKGTYLYDYCVENGYLDKNELSNELLYGGNIKYEHITKEELYGLQRTFSLYARLDEKYYPLIKKAEKFDEEGNEAFEKLKKIFYDNFFN